ncbi:MAG: MarR family transcriptional regulator [Deltaproteobacteria bacterium]|jgi:DNA-binding MarR family transcriptional regulator|nr:MarR family transcriptional regulator [Deltaproteobacteria bacterium]
MSNENVAAPETAMTGEILTELFRRVLQAMSRFHHRRGHARHAQGHVLDILRERAPMSQRDLMETLNVRSASLSEILAKLERNGCITRERSELDNRGFILHATEQGRAMAEERRKGYLENAETIFAPLSDAERRQLGEFLQKIITYLEKDAPGQGAGHGHGHGSGYRRGRGRHGHDEEHGHGRDRCGQDGEYGHARHGHAHGSALRHEHHWLFPDGLFPGEENQARDDENYT